MAEFLSTQSRYPDEKRDAVNSGVTNSGTYHAEFPVISSRQLRELRTQFKDAVVKRMQDGVEPQEVVL